MLKCGGEKWKSKLRTYSSSEQISCNIDTECVEYVKKNCVFGTICTETPFQASFPGLQKDRSHKVIVLVRVEMKVNTNPASVLEEDKVNIIYDLRENKIFNNILPC